MTNEPHSYYMHKSYRKACFPELTDVMVGTMQPNNLWFTNQSFCCNALECNRYQLPNGVAIRCYVCDSRVTGLEGCSILNVSRPHAYKYGTSSSSEQCAVSGLTGGKITFSYKQYIFLRQSSVW